MKVQISKGKYEAIVDLSNWDADEAVDWINAKISMGFYVANTNGQSLEN